MWGGGNAPKPTLGIAGWPFGQRSSVTDLAAHATRLAPAPEVESDAEATTAAAAAVTSRATINLFVARLSHTVKPLSRRGLRRRAASYGTRVSLAHSDVYRIG